MELKELAGTKNERAAQAQLLRSEKESSFSPNGLKLPEWGVSFADGTESHCFSGFLNDVEEVEGDGVIAGMVCNSPSSIFDLSVSFPLLKSTTE